MPNNKILINIQLTIGSIVFCLLLILLFEVGVRYFTSINFLGNDSNLFIPNAYGSSKGNARNAKSMSFGVEVYTNKHGFRVNSHLEEETTVVSSILILGDSVGFGVGVEEKETFAGLLSAKRPDISVLNSSVIGYTVNDYENVVDYFFLAKDYKKTIDQALLIYCLNDISSASAQIIDELFVGKASGDFSSVGANKTNSNIPATRERATTIEKNFVDRLREISFISSANNFLRTHSKLYLLIKGLITDPQRRYWEADLSLYKSLSKQEIERRLEGIAYINNVFKNHGVEFVVVISPYEFQLRSELTASDLPQKIVAEYLSEKNIDYIDMLPIYRKLNIESRNLFLPFDPMHLSAVGHNILFNMITKN